MKILYLILKPKRIKNIFFKKPNNKDLVIFDGMSNQYLTFVLEDFNILSLKNRKDRIKDINLSIIHLFSV